MAGINEMQFSVHCVAYNFNDNLRLLWINWTYIVDLDMQVYRLH